MDSLMYLKSGTDIRGTAIEKDGKPVDLTDERLKSIVNSLVVFLKEKLGKDDLSVTIGYDSRVSSPRISETVINTLLSLDVNVFNCGLSSTPSMFMSIINFNVDASIEITASHLPMEMNGLKFFTREGGFSGEDIKKILSYAENNPYSYGNVTSVASSLPNMEKYCANLCSVL